MQQAGGGPPFLAQTAAIGWKVAGTDGDTGRIGSQRHAALQRTVGTVGLDADSDRDELIGSQHKPH